MTPYRVWFTARTRDGGLVIQGQPLVPGAAVRGAFRLTVPAGPLADALAEAIVGGETWRFALADDGATIVGAEYAQEVQR